MKINSNILHFFITAEYTANLTEDEQMKRAMEMSMQESTIGIPHPIYEPSNENTPTNCDKHQSKQSAHNTCVTPPSTDTDSPMIVPSSRKRRAPLPDFNTDESLTELSEENSDCAITSRRNSEMGSSSKKRCLNFEYESHHAIKGGGARDVSDIPCTVSKPSDMFTALDEHERELTPIKHLSSATTTSHTRRSSSNTPKRLDELFSKCTTSESTPARIEKRRESELHNSNLIDLTGIDDGTSSPEVGRTTSVLNAWKSERANENTQNSPATTTNKHVQYNGTIFNEELPDLDPSFDSQDSYEKQCQILSDIEARNANNNNPRPDVKAEPSDTKVIGDSEVSQPSSGNATQNASNDTETSHCADKINGVHDTKLFNGPIPTPVTTNGTDNSKLNGAHSHLDQTNILNMSTTSSNPVISANSLKSATHDLRVTPEKRKRRSGGEISEDTDLMSKYFTDQLDRTFEKNKVDQGEEDTIKKECASEVMGDRAAGEGGKRRSAEKLMG